MAPNRESRTWPHRGRVFRSLTVCGFICRLFNQGNKYLPVGVKNVFLNHFPEFRDEGIDVLQYRRRFIHQHKRAMSVVFIRKAYRSISCPTITMNCPIRIRERDFPVRYDTLYAGDVFTGFNLIGVEFAMPEHSIYLKHPQ